MEEINIRNESAGDEEAVANLLRAAFGGDVEVGLVKELRQSGEIVRALIARNSETIVGYIAFSRAWFEGGEGLTELVWLAPLAVEPAHQNTGVGAALISVGLVACAESGFTNAVVVGDPAYYTRFGFSSERAAGLKTRWAGNAFMAVDLREDKVVELKGKLLEPAAFEGLD